MDTINIERDWVIKLDYNKWLKESNGIKEKLMILYLKFFLSDKKKQTIEKLLIDFVSWVNNTKKQVGFEMRWPFEKKSEIEIIIRGGKRYGGKYYRDKEVLYYFAKYINYDSNKLKEVIKNSDSSNTFKILIAGIILKSRLKEELKNDIKLTYYREKTRKSEDNILNIYIGSKLKPHYMFEEEEQDYERKISKYKIECPSCNGTGIAYSVRGGGLRSNNVPCNNCNGHRYKYPNLPKEYKNLLDRHCYLYFQIEEK